MPAATRRGLFITLEGGDGSGKSTQAATLAKRLEAEGHSICLTHDPAGTALGRYIWAAFQKQERAGAPIDPIAELLFFSADRAQHVSEIIRPALLRGVTVVSDRFADSTLAYQGYGRGLDLHQVRTCNDLATGGLRPDLTLLFDVPAELGLKRAATEESKPKDSLGQEPLEFHMRVRNGYLTLAREEPERIVVIDATAATEKVAEAAWEHVKTLLSRRG